MKRSHILFLLFLLLTNCIDRELSAERDPHNIDSLSSYISNASNTKLSNDLRKHFNSKALLSLKNSNNDSLNRISLFQVASNFYILNDEKAFKITSDILIEKASAARDSVQITKAYIYLGRYYTDLYYNDSAYYYYTKAERLSLIKKDTINLEIIYLNKAFIQLYENDYSGCELSSIKGLRFAKSTSDKRRIYDFYNLIAISSNELKNYSKAIEYHKKAINLVKEYSLENASYLLANSLNNLAVVYQNLSRHKEAIINLEAALKQKNVFKSNRGLYAILLDNLAYSQFKLKEFKNIPRLFYLSLNIRDSLQLNSGIIINKIHLSEFYYYRKDTSLAIKFAKEAFNLAKETRVAGDILSSLKQTSVVDPKNLAFYSKEYIRINDSLHQTERNIRDKFARIAYETNEITLQKDQLEVKNRNLLYFFMSILMIGTLLFVIRNQRAKNRELLLIQGQQKANEDIYNLMIAQQSKLEEGRIAEKKRIAQELHDGVLGRLFGTRLNLDSLNRMNDDQAIVKRNNYLVELKNIEQDIREISHDLNREKYVLINNFVAILTNLLEEQKANFRPDVAVHIDEKIKWDEITNTLKINLYRIIQESLQNINKYAQATTISLEIKMLEGNLGTIITDNGVGFDINVRKKGIGLQNILSRTQELDGSCDITSKSENGTSIILSFPIKTSNNNIAKDVNA